VDAVAKAHGPNLCFSAWSTAGWTSCDTSPA
jgi:hypothetical protein